MNVDFLKLHTDMLQIWCLLERQVRLIGNDDIIKMKYRSKCQYTLYNIMGQYKMLTPESNKFLLAWQMVLISSWTFVVSQEFLQKKKVLSHMTRSHMKRMDNKKKLQLKG